MTYFSNKFNKEFLYLCRKQTPKGGSVRLDSSYHPFWEFRRRGNMNQPKTVEVIPLLLGNHISSSNPKEDKNVEDYMMICKDKSDTVVTFEYKTGYSSQQSDEEFVCDFGIVETTGDLESDPNLNYYNEEYKRWKQ